MNRDKRDAINSANREKRLKARRKIESQQEQESTMRNRQRRQQQALGLLTFPVKQ
jgi:hypothetical protein